jgi:hypothetical protein
MKWGKSTTVAPGRVLAVLGVLGALLVISAGPGLAQSNQSASKRGLEGTWFVQVTLRDCVTNAPLGPPFNSLVTFHRGGTLSESTSGTAFAPGQRTDSHGNWGPDAHGTYSQRMLNLINFDTTPGNFPVFFAGWSTIDTTIDLIDADHATSSGTNAFYKADGTLYRTGCSTAVSRRFD